MYGLNNLKLDGSYAERRRQVSSFPCFIYTIRASIRGFKLLSLTAQFEAILSVLPNCLTCTRLTFSAPQSVICLPGSQRHHFLVKRPRAFGNIFHHFRMNCETHDYFFLIRESFWFEKAGKCVNAIAASINICINYPMLWTACLS